MVDGERSPTMDTEKSLKMEEVGENLSSAVSDTLAENLSSAVSDTLAENLSSAVSDTLAENLSSAVSDTLAEGSGSINQGAWLEEGEEHGNTGGCTGTDSGDPSDCSDVDYNGSVETLKHAIQDLCVENVLCDSCIESPRQAVKSCLTCLVSYCEAHLRPHLESRRFQSHQLVAPQMDLEVRCCQEHRLPLELFCKADTCGVCLCRACWEQGHQDHNTLLVAEARRLAEAELQRKKREMMRTVSTAEDAITNLRNNITSAESSAMRLQRSLEQQFSRLQVAVERARAEVREVLEGELKRVACQAESIRAHLHLKICQLKKSLVSGERFSNNKNDVDFMQEYCEWMRASVDIDLPGIYISLPDRLSTFRQTLSDTTQELCEHLLTSYRCRLTGLCHREGLDRNTTILSTTSDINASKPEPMTRSDFLSYMTNLTINTDSAHQFLRLTEGNKRLTNTTPWQHCYQQHPERFEHWRQALASESLFLGRHYFEVELRGEGTHVGLTYHSIQRKSAEPSGCITGNTFSWSLGQTGHGLSCWHADKEICLQGEPLSRVGVYVDYQAGVIAFYGVTGSMKLLHKYRTRFLEPLYPAFWLSKKDDAICLLNITEH